MLPQNWNLGIIDIKDCFFQIPLHPDDAPRFTFLIPTLNREAPRKKYHWKFLPQGMKNSPSICQWYLSSLLSPVCIAVGEAIILHYMDDVLVCAPNDDLLSHALDLTIDSLVVAAGFELHEERIQRMPPWKYLGLKIGKRTIVPQKLVVKNSIKILADVQQFCGSLNWVRSWLGLTTEDLDPLFNLLKGENCQLQLKAKPPVMVKDPATRETEGPHDLITWGHGYTCVSTPPGLKWVPAEWVKPFIPKTAKPPAEAPQVASAAWRRRKRRTFSF
ncbi:hypothetical protein DUI87_08545 [Hirundo rustica rustica]|uniref:ribonuclease H n=1 Tax=Hirundo rustica rustica TaxID=333673 RepID=A0A3M0KJP4_HIRRU|nr:hypothetical protein DUI87_08545 [Hirundo rustica rustica]